MAATQAALLMRHPCANVIRARADKLNNRPDILLQSESRTKNQTSLQNGGVHISHVRLGAVRWHEDEESLVLNDPEIHRRCHVDSGIVLGG